MDYPYVFIITLLIILTYRSWNLQDRRNYFIWSVCLTFIFFAFRACVVGADTYNYTLGFLEKKNIYNDVEPLYNVYTDALRMIWKNEVFFIIMNTLCSLTMLYIFVKKYSLNSVLSVLLFFLFSVYQPYFVALRQILAISILLVGMYVVLNDSKKRWIIYVACATIAYFMHNSTLLNSILFAALYFINISNRKAIILLIIGSAFVGVVLQVLNLTTLFNMYLSMNLEFTTERLNNFIQSDQINNLNSSQGYIWLLRWTWVGLFVYSFMDKEKLNHWFSKIFFIGILLFNMFYNVDMIARMNLPFIMFSIIVFTWAFEKTKTIPIKKSKIVNVLGILLLLYFTQFFVREQVGYDLDSASRMHPYYFFWENYQSHPSITRFY